MKTVLSAIAAAAVATTVLSVGGSATAAGGCVTAAEYGRIHNGMLQSTVHRIFGTSGKSLFRNPGDIHNEAREYAVCGHPRSSGSFVQVQYNNYSTHGGPVRVTFSQMQVH